VKSEALSSSLNRLKPAKMDITAPNTLGIVLAVCRECGEWSRLQVTPENYGQVTNKNRCTYCDSPRLDPRSVISEETFNPERAKVKTKEILRLKARRRR